VADYAALFGRQGQGSIYQELEEVTTGLLSKVVEIAFPGEARRKKFQWLSMAGWILGEVRKGSETVNLICIREQCYSSWRGPMPKVPERWLLFWSMV
jgi:hypothetical protein